MLWALEVPFGKFGLGETKSASFFYGAAWSRTAGKPYMFTFCMKLLFLGNANEMNPRLEGSAVN